MSILNIEVEDIETGVVIREAVEADEAVEGSEVWRIDALDLWQLTAGIGSFNGRVVVITRKR